MALWDRLCQRRRLGRFADLIDRGKLPRARISFQRDVQFIRDINGLAVGVSDSELVTRITCPRCGRTSSNPNDVREGYCGNCSDWTSQPGPAVSG